VGSRSLGVSLHYTSKKKRCVQPRSTQLGSTLFSHGQNAACPNWRWPLPTPWPTGGSGAAGAWTPTASPARKRVPRRENSGLVRGNTPLSEPPKTPHLIAPAFRPKVGDIHCPPFQELNLSIDDTPANTAMPVRTLSQRRTLSSTRPPALPNHRPWPPGRHRVSCGFTPCATTRCNSEWTRRLLGAPPCRKQEPMDEGLT